MSDTESEFVTCPCNTCAGKIQFDRALFDPAAPAVVTCPHCGLETTLHIPSTPVAIPAPTVPPQIPIPPVICPPPVKAKNYGRGVAVAGFVVVVLLLGVSLAKTLLDYQKDYQERSKVQVISTEVKYDPVNLTYDPAHPVRAFAVWVRNGSRFAIRDIHVEWEFYAQSGTRLGTYDFTFYETLQPSDSRTFQTDFVRAMPDRTEKYGALIRGFEFVK
jgi:hypothetical protein